MTRWTPPPLRKAQTQARITLILLPSLTVIHSCLLTEVGRSKKLEKRFAAIGSSHRHQVIKERSGSISRSQSQSSCPQTSWRDVWNQLLSTRLHILKLKHIKWSFKHTLLSLCLLLASRHRASLCDYLCQLSITTTGVSINVPLACSTGEAWHSCPACTRSPEDRITTTGFQRLVE